MNISKSILLGILQGSTEFLPISSSGHLLMARELLALGDLPLLYDVLLHVATLLAVLWIFRRSFLQYTQWVLSASARGMVILRNVVIALLPTAFFGFVIHQWLPVSRLGLTGFSFMLTAVVLLLSRKKSGRIRIWEMSWKLALVIGIAQGFAVVPGISRSGSTLAIAILLGMERSDAADFSFLIAIPAILGALMLTLSEGVSSRIGISFWVLTLGMVSATVTGIVCLKFLLRLLKNKRLDVFAWYLIPLGLGVIIWSVRFL